MNELAKIDNNETMPATSQAGEHLALQARAQVEVQVSTAKAYPRKIKDACERALTAAIYNVDVAERMFYRLREGDKWVEGPSVRLAEIFFSQWQNISAGSKAIEINDTYLVAAGYCHDMETNVRVEVQEVASILTKNGKRYSENLIAKTMKAAMSKARRNAIFQVIPRVFIEGVMKKAKQVAAGEGKSQTERWKELVDRAKLLKVSDKQLLQLIGKSSMSELILEDFASLASSLAMIEDEDETITSLLEQASSQRRGTESDIIQGEVVQQ